MDEKKKKGILPYSRFPNYFKDNLIKPETDLSRAEIKILFFIYDRTWCWGYDYSKLPTKTIAIKTGISERKVNDALKSLEKRKIIINFKNEKDYKNKWGINQKYSEWIMSKKSFPEDIEDFSDFIDIEPPPINKQFRYTKEDFEALERESRK